MNPANKTSNEGEYSATDLVRIGPFQIGEVTGPDPVYLRPDHVKGSMQEADKSVFLVFAPVIIYAIYACRSII